MRFSKKLTVAERAAEKRLGWIKHAIMTKMNADVKAVKINCHKHTVTYNKVDLLFKTTKQGERVYSGIGVEVKDEVEAKVAAWLKMREHEDSD